jgi:SAM-dependent methyltransferase
MQKVRADMKPHLDPSPIIDIATAYWGSATLIAASKLNLFSLVDEAPLSAAQVARQAELDLPATDALLTGCVGLGLLTKSGELYGTNELSSAFLVEGKPGFLGPALAYNGDVYPLWAALSEVIRTGDTRQSPDQYLGDNSERTRNFVYGMHHRALGVGRAVAQVMDLNGRTKLADIGGGPGTYSALLTQQTPGLTATVFDLPGVVAIAQDIVASMGAGEAVACAPFDYYTDELQTQYDAALISGVLHREQPEGARALIAKAAKALAPGGVFYISDVMLNDTRTGPLFGTMFALNMRVLAHNGRCHSVAEQSAWLEESGCTVTEVTQLPAPINYTVIRAEKSQ